MTLSSRATVITRSPHDFLREDYTLAQNDQVLTSVYQFELLVAKGLFMEKKQREKGLWSTSCYYHISMTKCHKLFKDSPNQHRTMFGR